MVVQLSHWDNVGTEPGAGDAEYVAGDQPVAEWDNWFNWSAAKDVENLIAALENVTTGHDHDGVNSKQVDGSDVVNTPAGTIAATDVQAAIDELDTEKLAEALFDANTVIKADSDDTPVALTVAEQTLVGRITAGVVAALTAAQVRTLLNVEDGADVTDTDNVDAAGAAMNSDKNVADGIAGLDVSGDVLLAQIPDALTGKTTDGNAVIASDSYTGNDTANRAIAHGLGRQPKFIYIYTPETRNYQFVVSMDGYVKLTYSAGDYSHAVTTSDATNFYVGNASNYLQSANDDTNTYQWVAIG